MNTKHMPDDDLTREELRDLAEKFQRQYYKAETDRESLLDALEAIIAGWDEPTYGDNSALSSHLYGPIRDARAAIAKARNE